MTAVLWPCDACRRQGLAIAGVRNVGAEGFCAAHLVDLYTLFGPEAWVDGGVGLPDGPLRPEYGPLEADLRCCCCQATWAGIPGDACGWCQRSRQIQEGHQTDLLLTPPDVDPADATYETRMGAWAERLAVGIEAGLISLRQAEHAAKAVAA